MAGLVPAIHVLFAAEKKDVDARNKCGHDGGELFAPYINKPCRCGMSGMSAGGIA
jgi:hypothetical protein